MFASRFEALIPARTLTAIALCLALFAAGCEKKPTRVTPPVLVPSIEGEPQPAMQPEPEPNENVNPAPEPAPAATPPSDEKPKPKTRKPAPKKPAQPAPAEPSPSKSEPAKPAAPGNSAQITAAVPRAALQSQMQETEQLLRNSQGRLGGINRSLSDGEQGMLRQARNYIAQSNQALQSGDIERAYNLAVKANLLTNELTK